MNEVFRRKVMRLRQAAERHEPGSLFASRAYWRDLLDLCEHVEHLDSVLGDIERQLAGESAQTGAGG